MSDQINLLRIQVQQQIAEIHRLQFKFILRQPAVDFFEQFHIEACKLAVLIYEADLRKSSTRAYDDLSYLCRTICRCRSFGCISILTTVRAVISATCYRQCQ
ncbi:hypothetical protein D3C76_1660690 [compost metagenome]